VKQGLIFCSCACFLSDLTHELNVRDRPDGHPSFCGDVGGPWLNSPKIDEKNPPLLPSVTDLGTKVPNFDPNFDITRLRSAFISNWRTFSKIQKIVKELWWPYLMVPTGRGGSPNYEKRWSKWVPKCPTKSKMVKASKLDRRLSDLAEILFDGIYESRRKMARVKIETESRKWGAATCEMVKIRFLRKSRWRRAVILN